MKLTLITQGDKPPSWIKQGFEDYQKRFPKSCELKLIEISTKNKTGKNSLKDYSAAIPPKSLLIALDEQGELWDTQKLANHLQHWKMSGKNIVFLIGGADGLDPALRQSVDHCWSLSRSTFPHQLVKVIVAEQLYRAHTLLSGHPYHRE